MRMELHCDPSVLPRELQRHYISATEQDIAYMLRTVGMHSLDDLYADIPREYLFEEPPDLPDEVSYETLQAKLTSIAAKNAPHESFIGDGLPDFSVHPIVPFVSAIRNLSTAYTPYQAERSQGTLISHWIYQCLLSMLTGFEAINASLYDRATAIYEAICVALRLKRGADSILIPKALYPGDLEVLETMAAGTGIELNLLPLDPATGRIDAEGLQAEASRLGSRLAAIVFAQTNTLGILEEVDALADLTRRAGALSIAVIDPMLLASEALKPPTEFGKSGADIIVGEGQHLAIGPNFGGPGLGVFGIRFNENAKRVIRVSPGRYVGRAVDLQGRPCYAPVLSTREQHIRKEKATSNICSNQAFLATLAGAAILARGERGMAETCRKANALARSAAWRLCALPGVELAFPEAPFFNEFVLRLPLPAKEAIGRARGDGLHLGVDVSDRIDGGNGALLKLSFSDKERDLGKLVASLESMVGAGSEPGTVPEVPHRLRRPIPPELPEIPLVQIRDYYERLGRLNVSPDDACYPLGSCTMKYNPVINDWAAGLPGFTDTHPQAPIEDSQGCLEILYEVQEWFKAITGLPAVTTQPVAGAQGELIALKMFQAYHRDRSRDSRDVIFIPRSAHGTNFATAAMAGYATDNRIGRGSGIVLLEADLSGAIDLADLERKIAHFGHRISGIMVTNPNTTGIFEIRISQIAEKIHAVGGLVYMDGANMNAIAGRINLSALGVDAVHNNLHKTWSIPHGGGGPGDAIVAVSQHLAEYLPGRQIEKRGGRFIAVKPRRSIGSFHRHWGNFAHKVRCLSYLSRLGRKGIPRMSAVAVLSAVYLFKRLGEHYPALPEGAAEVPRMHEFILTLEPADFDRLEGAGVSKSEAMTRVGKLFLDFGFHAPTVAWPERFGLMIEPTESYTAPELDRFAEAVIAILRIIREKPRALNEAPFFTPVTRIDEVTANRELCLSERLEELPQLHPNRLDPEKIAALTIEEITQRILDT